MRNGMFESEYGGAALRGMGGSTALVVTRALKIVENPVGQHTRLTRRGLLPQDPARDGVLRATRGGDCRTCWIRLASGGADHPCELPTRRRTPTLHEDCTWQRACPACRGRCSGCLRSGLP